MAVAVTRNAELTNAYQPLATLFGLTPGATFTGVVSGMDSNVGTVSLCDDGVGSATHAATLATSTGAATGSAFTDLNLSTLWAKSTEASGDYIELLGTVFTGSALSPD